MTPRPNPLAPGWPLPASAAAAAVLLLGCWVWAWRADVTLVFGKAASVLALMVAVRLYEHVRFRDYARLILLTDSLIVVCLMGAGVAFLSYLTAMADWPLRDRELLALDRALGFDWRPAMHAVDQWPLLVGLLGLAYQTHTAQIACVVLFLALRNRPKDLDAFLLAFLIAGALTTTISALVPALGPASLFGDQNFINLKLTGATPADVLAQLRAGSARIIDLDHMAGIVTFPSFHTVIALLVVHAMRRDGWLLMPAVGLNALMLASTITEGGHYVADVLAGSAVTLVAVTVAGALTGSRAARAPLRPALPKPA